MKQISELRNDTLGVTSVSRVHLAIWLNENIDLVWEIGNGKTKTI